MNGQNNQTIPRPAMPPLAQQPVPPEIQPPAGSSLLPAGNNFGLAVKIIIAAIVLAVVSVTVCLAARIWDPLWNPFRPNPERVVEKMFLKMKEVKSLRFESKMAVNADIPGSSGRVFLKMSGGEDNRDPNNKKAFSNFEITFSSKDAGEARHKPPIRLRISIESKALGEDFYLKINEISLPSFLEQTAEFDLSSLEKQWIKINQESVAGLCRQFGAECDFPDENAQKSATARLEELFSESKIYVVKKELADEKINNQKMYHYYAVLNNEEVAKLFGEIMKLSAETQPGAESQSFLGQNLVSGMVEGMVKNFLQEVGEIGFDLWVGKKDNLLYKVSGAKEIDASRFESGTEGLFTVNFEAVYSDFEKPLNIEPPAKPKPIGEVVSEIIAVINEKSLEGRASENMDKLRVAAAAIYGANRSYLKLNCKNASLKNICADLKTDIGADPTIRVLAKKYCAYVKLPFRDRVAKKDKYICVDSSKLQPVETFTDPAASNYCGGSVLACPSGTLPFLNK